MERWRDGASTREKETGRKRGGKREKEREREGERESETEQDIFFREREGNM